MAIHRQPSQLHTAEKSFSRIRITKPQNYLTVPLLRRIPIGCFQNPKTTTSRLRGIARRADEAATSVASIKRVTRSRLLIACLNRLEKTCYLTHTATAAQGSIQTMINNSHPAFLEQLQADPLAAVAEHYARCLADNPKAGDYLQRSGLWSGGISELRVGFADRSLGKQIPAKTLTLGRKIRAELESLGVFRSNGREHFRGMVTLPLT